MRDLEFWEAVLMLPLVPFLKLKAWYYNRKLIRLSFDMMNLAHLALMRLDNRQFIPRDADWMD